MDESSQDSLFEKASETLDLAQKKIYEPICMFTKGFTSFNFLAYKTAKDISKPTPEDLLEFAIDTEKKLGVHPLYLLHKLKNEYRLEFMKLKRLQDRGMKQNYIPTMEEFMSNHNNSKGIKTNVDDQIELNRIYRNNISRAILKLSKKNPFYVS